MSVFFQYVLISSKQYQCCKLARSVIPGTDSSETLISDDPLWVVSNYRVKKSWKKDNHSSIMIWCYDAQ